MKTECRARLGINLRAVTDAEKASGYIGAITGTIPFNSDSAELRDRSVNNGRPFIERIDPAAFKRSLNEDKDIMAFAGHTDAPLAAFARAGENLTFNVTEAAIEWRALIPDTQAGRDLKTLAESKIIRGTSFEFAPRGGGDKWEKRDGKDVRTITDAKLYAVNPVAWPAYPESELTVSMRSARSMAVYAETYDPTLSEDACYAMEQIASELEELTEAQEYLRENPEGALKDYATQCVTDCSAELNTLLAWLTANGAIPAETPVMDRARKVIAGKTFTDEDRERRHRVLKLRSI